MKRLFLSTLCLAVLSTTTVTASLELIGKRLHRLEVKHTWHSVSALPVSLRTALAELFRQRSLEMANPGGQWAGNVSVIREGQRSPAGRRLLFAFETPDLYVVYLEYAPPAVHTAALIFEKNPTLRSVFVWGGNDSSLRARAKSPQELVRRIVAKQFDDEPGTVW
jgi:hypothetical protein